MSETKNRRGAGQVDPARREALAKMGRFAAYTAPSVLTLLIADRAVAHSGGGGEERQRGRISLQRFLRRLFARFGDRGFG